MYPKRGWVFILALFLQMVAVRAPGAYGVLLPISYALLLVGTLSNLHMWGFKSLLVGLALNILPLAAHQWYMPVAGSALAAVGFSREAGLAAGARLAGSKNVLLPREDTAFWFLSDIIPVTWPMPLLLSPGDLVILVSLGLLAWEILRMLTWKHKKETQWRSNKLPS